MNRKRDPSIKNKTMLLSECKDYLKNISKESSQMLEN